MRIAIVNSTKGQISGGYHKYLKNVIPRIANHSCVEALFCASPKSWNIQSWFDSDAVPKATFMDCSTLSPFVCKPEKELGRRLKEFSPDVLFIPTERYFRFEEVPVVNMVQNMEPLTYSSRKNPFRCKSRNLCRKLMSRWALRKSDRVIAVSEFVKEFLVKNMGISSSKVCVVYHGISSNGTVNAVRPQTVPENRTKGFLFTAGSIRPARGLEDIIGALNSLVSENIDVNLVIAGNTEASMLSYRKRLEKDILKNNLSERVIWAGNLSETEMEWCYENCLLFVMTSRVESFGLVALEALSKGCICVVANNPCLPEVFSDVAIYYPPANEKTLAEEIQKVLNWDNYRQQEFAERAKKRAAAFSWEKTIEKLVGEFAICRKFHNL